MPKVDAAALANIKLLPEQSLSLKISGTSVSIQFFVA